MSGQSWFQRRLTILDKDRQFNFWAFDTVICQLVSLHEVDPKPLEYNPASSQWSQISHEK